MTIVNFTPVSATIGGVLIGIAAVLMLFGNGRIAGISGYLSRLIPTNLDDHTVPRAAFIIGLVLGPWLATRLSDLRFSTDISSNTGLLIAAALLVGFGSVWGSGCTSGHGVCGLARLSQRSLIATATFMTTGVATVFIMRHVLGG